MIGSPGRPTLLLSILLVVPWLPIGLNAQNATESKDNLRILFDSKGGFKPYHLDATDSTYHPLLNPALDAPVGLEVFRNGTLIPLKFVEETATAEDDDPGYRGPAYTAEDIQIRVWGLDVSATNPNWSVIRYEFTNSATSSTTLSIRFIFDTWLGESGREPILVLQSGDGQPSVITDETQIKADDQTRLIGSVKPDASDSLYFLMTGKAWPNLSPQKVLIANIRRLQNSGYSYDLEEHRAFNLLPFSINDSALAFYYDSQVILPNQRVAIDLLMSHKPDTDAKNLANLRIALSAIPISKIKTSPIRVAPTMATGGNRDELIKQINSMLAKLNSLMATPDYRQGDIERLVKAITETQKLLQANP